MKCPNELAENLSEQDFASLRDARKRISLYQADKKILQSHLQNLREFDGQLADLEANVKKLPDSFEKATAEDKKQLGEFEKLFEGIKKEAEKIISAVNKLVEKWLPKE